MSATSIDEVVAQLDAIATEAERTGSRVGYFAALYRKVTAEVRASIRRGEFLDGGRMERLDVTFANRYIDAWEAYRTGQPVTESWRIAFDACADREPTILQHLYVGLTAHLLLDLGVAAAVTAPGPRLRDLHGDFEHINEIVGRLMREVDGVIGALSPWIGYVDRFAGVPYAAVNKIGISVARDLAWRSASRLAALDPAAHPPVIESLDREVAIVARALARPRGLPRLFIKGVRSRESNDVSLVIRTLRGAGTAPRPRRRVRVAVLGGGVGGLTAAHELVERGFDVDVYESALEVGGKSRSQFIAGTGVGGRRDLPGEHGFRFFPSFYRHVIDTMQRIPVPEGSVAHRLRRSDEMAMAEENATYRFERHEPRSVGDILDIVETTNKFFRQTGVREADVARFAHAMLKFMVSCDERRVAEYEFETFWDFVGGDDCAPSFQKYLRTPRFMVAMDPRHGSARTVSLKAIQILADFFRNGTRTDGVLDGPTTERWLQPWYRDLAARGVRFHFGKRVEELVQDGRRLSGVRISGELVRADHYVLAVPLDRAASLVTDGLANVDPALEGLRRLGPSTSWMVGAQFYFSRPLEICKGHVAYPDSDWALSSVSQAQFWDNGTAGFGDGTVRDILSVDISDWNSVSRRIGKTAKDCKNADEVLDEVWTQLKEALGDKLDPKLLVARHLDENVVFEPGQPVRNTTPLLVHPPGSYRLRPPADVAVENLFLASDYVKTNTDLASMEGANEAARRAVNAIVDAEGISASPCAIWSMEEDVGPIAAMARKVDRDIFLLQAHAPDALPGGALGELRSGPLPNATEDVARIATALANTLRSTG